MTEIKNEIKVYDVVIVGGGVAGITAAIYAKRAGRKVVVLERMAIGGQLNFVGKVENYTGFGITDGASLVDSLYSHIDSLGIEVVYDEVIDYQLESEDKIVSCKNGNYQSKAVVLALGSNPKELEVEGEKEFKGRGVSYCVQCDGNFFKGKTAAVVGSNQAAIDDACYLSQIAEKVYLISQFDISNMMLEKIKKISNIEIIEDAKPIKIIGNEAVKCMVVEKAEKSLEIKIEGVFVVAGKRPNTSALDGKVKLSQEGFILCNEDMQTNLNGVFACGDVRKSKLKQIATAVGDGAIAGVMASIYVLNLKK